jgi:predicted aspartyl protease
LGHVYVDLVVRGKSSRRIRALVDTGSAYIVLDPKTISEVGLFEAPFEVELTLADKGRARAKLYLAEVEAEGRRGPALVAELDVPTPITGGLRSRGLGAQAQPAYRPAGGRRPRGRVPALALTSSGLPSSL